MGRKHFVSEKAAPTTEKDVTFSVRLRKRCVNLALRQGSYHQNKLMNSDPSTILSCENCIGVMVMSPML
jgi:hypothetical protein